MAARDADERESSVVLFGRRRLEVPAALEEALEGLCITPRVSRSDRLVVSGIGASEGPARAFASLARSELSVDASFAPFSSFYAAAPRCASTTFVAFSQGLSPNARMALDRAHHFAACWLFTSVRASTAAPEAKACLAQLTRCGATVVALPPVAEAGMLARLVGPAVAILAGCFFVGASRAGPAGLEAVRSSLRPAVRAVREAGERVARALEGVPADVWSRPVVFVAAGEHLERCRGLSHRWLEALPGPEPALWDVLQFAHGPFQSIWDRTATLITLERSDPAEREMFDRLASVLSPARHVLVRLQSDLPASIALLDHDAQVNELIWRFLAIAPRDTSGWPGSGLDAALYGLDAPAPTVAGDEASQRAGQSPGASS
jgi:hypothetical protein